MTIKNQFQQETQGNVLTKLAKNMAAYGGSCTRQTRLGAWVRTGRRTLKRSDDEPRAPHRQGASSRRYSRLATHYITRVCDADHIRKPRDCLPLATTIQCRATLYIPLEDARHWRMLDQPCCCSQAIRSSTLHAASVQPN